MGELGLYIYSVSNGRWKGGVVQNTGCIWKAILFPIIEVLCIVPENLRGLLNVLTE